MSTKAKSAPKAKSKKKLTNMDYAKPKPRPKKEVKKGPRQQALNGMEDRAVNSLEELALEYAEIRDERIALSVQEGQKKAELISEMKRLKKEHYKRDGITIDLVMEKENVKVKVKAKDEEDDEPSIEEGEEVSVAVDPVPVGEVPF